MEHARTLLTGLHGAALRDRVLDQPIDPETLWIAPSPLAAEQILARLTLRRGLLARPRVWTWSDFWREIGRRSPDPPAILSSAGRHSVLRLAIDQHLADDSLDRTAMLVQTLGYRRALLRTFDRWTSSEQHASSTPHRFTTEIEREEWGLYRSYRALLSEIGAEDDAGYASWASKVLASDPQSRSGRFPHVVVFEPRLSGRAIWRAFEWLAEHARRIQVTHSGRPGLSPARDALRDRILSLEFVETPIGTPRDRSAILTFLESKLFDSGDREPPPINRTPALRILGAPAGEGLALVIAREVRERINAGYFPNQILILVPNWDDQADRIVETLRSWGIGVTALGSRPLTADPTIAALLRAARLPSDEWDAAQLVGLLRHGQVGSSWHDLDPARAALAIRETGVFRGRDMLRLALVRRDESSPKDTAERRAMAVEIVDRLSRLFEGVNDPATWDEHLTRFRHIAENLGLGGLGSDRRGLDSLLDQLACAGEVRRRLGRDSRTGSWDEFVREVDSLVRTISISELSESTASVVVATVDAAAGTRAEIVILANLGEGTFPSRDALDVRDRSGDPAKEADAIRRAIGGEMARFLRVIGSADRAAVLAYPTKDQSGVPLNMAGFVDELKDCLGSAAWEACATILPRLMPILSEDLAGSPHEARVRAMGSACANPGRETFPLLASLSGEPRHREILQRVAVALRVAHQRQARRQFGPFDGMLHDPAAARRIAEDFGPARHAFSASQLETLSLCPFQFFLRYVCHLAPTAVRGEFDEDLSLRGRVVHEALQSLHERLRDTPADDGGSTAERVAQLVESAVLGILELYETPATEQGHGIRLIESRILAKTSSRYAGQFLKYAQKHPDAACSHFEVDFGPKAGAYGPCLEIGQGEDSIRLQGQIDRIDTIQNENTFKFRIIDYKNGGVPGLADLKSGLALQLPLYAMAAESVILAGRGIEPDSAGYWSLKKDGYKSLVKMNDDGTTPWPILREALERFVVELAQQLRQGRLPVRPRANDCMTRCDYSTVCRIGSSKRVGKVWNGAPTLELEE
jgi:RecB family exonuclease